MICNLEIPTLPSVIPAATMSCLLRDTVSALLVQLHAYSGPQALAGGPHRDGFHIVADWWVVSSLQGRVVQFTYGNRMAHRSQDSASEGGSLREAQGSRYPEQCRYPGSCSLQLATGQPAVPTPSTLGSSSDSLAASTPWEGAKAFQQPPPGPASTTLLQLNPSLWAQILHGNPPHEGCLATLRLHFPEEGWVPGHACLACSGDKGVLPAGSQQPPILPFLLDLGDSLSLTQ